ncbi:MAG: adenosylcobinamide-GDP ribazoletransferase [Deltaproteobacteria bacterium]|nr:MAG: adenosylcobinamide-GDP ribazoletransferase [Deltaproteobacteria bacterium]
MTALLRELRLAVAFLSRLPVGAPAEVAPRQLGRSLAFFPLVGLLLGALLAGIDQGLAHLLPRPVGDALLLALLALLSGALHLDGFADLCDGLGGGRDREAALRIMKDSCIGAFGAVGLILLLLLKYQALLSLPAAVKPAALLLLPAAGRWAPVLLTVAIPYLRGPEGTGAAFAAHAGRRELLLASMTVLAAAAALFRAEGVMLAGILLAAAAGFGVWMKRRLGGVTGDVLGAAVELLELLTLLLLLILVKG